MELQSVGVPCFDSLANQKTRQHQNQSLELQDLVLLFSERDLSKVCFAKVYLVCFQYWFLDQLLSVGICLFGWVELIQQNIKILGKIYRTVKYLFHWAMESKRGHNILIKGYGISKGKSNLATGSFCFWNGMNINDLEREF